MVLKLKLRKFFSEKLLAVFVCIIFIFAIKNYSNVTMINTHKKNLNDFDFIKIGEFEPSNVTIISIYFKFKSKHSFEEYLLWTENFAKSINAPLVMFCDYESLDRLYELRGNKTTLFFPANNVWEYFRVLEIERGKNYTDNYLNKQSKQDKHWQRKEHNPTLFACWNLKALFTKYIALLNPYNSSFFIYTDSGAWRDRVLTNWPSYKFVSQLENYLEDRILYGLISPYQKEFYNMSRYLDLIEGTFYAGNKQAMLKHYTIFYDLHDKLFDEGKFVGNDQHLMNIIRFNTNRDFVVHLETWSFNCTFKYDPWFVYQYYFSNQFNQFCNDSQLFSHLKFIN